MRLETGMSEQPQAAQEAVEEQQTKQPAETATPEAKTEPVGTEAVKTEAAQGDIDSLPAWAKKEITTLRTEAAGWRTKLREHEAQFKDALPAEQVAELRDRWREAAKAAAVAEAGLPVELADRVSGDDLEAMRADAKQLAGLLGRRPVERGELRGGVNPQQGVGSGESMADRVKRLRRR